MKKSEFSFRHYLGGLFLGMTISVLAVIALTSGAGLALPLLASVLLHAGLLELLIAEESGGIHRPCFFGGLLAGLAPLGLVLIPWFGSLEAALGSVLAILGYTNPILDLDGTKEGCGI